MNIEEVKERLKKFQDDKFIFEPIEHKYTYTNKPLISCTTFIERFKKPFDKKYWSQKKAKDNGVSVESIVEKWDKKRDRACDLGTMVHDNIEHFYENNKFKKLSDKEANDRIKEFQKLYDKELYKFQHIASEVMMFHNEWGIAGTFDQLFYKDGEIIIADWKTNEKFTTNKDYAFEYLKYPFNRYKKNSLTIYSIQISIYRLMLEHVGINTSYGFIVHIPPKGECQIYKLLDFRDILKKYFKDEMSEKIILENKKW